MSTGVNFDIVLNLITQYGSSVTVTPVTKTISNIEGDETLTEGTTYSETVYLSRKSTDWSFDEAGLVKGGDAVMIITPSSSIKKDDLVKHNDTTYRVQNIIKRTQAGGTNMFTSCNLFLVEDE